VRPLWQGFDRLILNGDVAEVHHPDHRVQAAREAIRLLDFCERDGIAVTILSGNHDPFISDHRHLELSGGQVFVTHGDVFHPAVAPWSPNAARMRRAHREALASIAPESTSALEARLSASQLASNVEWEELAHQAGHSTIRSMLVRPWAIVQVLAYWWRFPGIVAEFANEHDIPARYILTGHTHRAGVWGVRDRVVINTGAYGFPGRPLGVVVRPEALEVRAIERAAGRYRLREAPDVTYPLDASPVERPHPSALNTRDVSDRLMAAAMHRPALKSPSSDAPVSTPIRPQR